MALRQMDWIASPSARDDGANSKPVINLFVLKT